MEALALARPCRGQVTLTCARIGRDLVTANSVEGGPHVELELRTSIDVVVPGTGDRAVVDKVRNHLPQRCRPIGWNDPVMLRCNNRNRNVAGLERPGGIDLVLE